MGLAGSGEKEDQTTLPQQGQGQGSRDPPLHRRRDRTHLRKTGVAAHAKPHTTIRSVLVAPKDKDNPQDKCGVLYQLTCHDFEASYIGETERALKQRLKEHQKDSSPVGHHMGYSKHKVDSQNIRIVDRDSRWFQRGVREAIQIRSRSPTLNRDRGRHNLPSVYNTIVRDTRMTAAVSRYQNQS